MLPHDKEYLLEPASLIFRRSVIIGPDEGNRGSSGKSPNVSVIQRSVSFRVREGIFQIHKQGGA